MIKLSEPYRSAVREALEFHNCYNAYPDTVRKEHLYWHLTGIIDVLLVSNPDSIENDYCVLDRVRQPYSQLGEITPDD